jgi:hypothetical protein
MRDILEIIQPWGFFCDEDRFETIDSIPTSSGLAAPGVFFLPPAVVAILFADGFWQAANRQLGTLMDRAEEEDLSPNQLFKLADLAEGFAMRYGADRIERQVGLRDGIPVVASVSASELKSLLNSLSGFLRAQAAEGKTVVASL